MSSDIWFAEDIRNVLLTAEERDRLNQHLQRGVDMGAITSFHFKSEMLLLASLWRRLWGKGPLYRVQVQLAADILNWFDENGDFCIGSRRKPENVAAWRKWNARIGVQVYGP